MAASLYTLTEELKRVRAGLEREPIDPETGEVTEAPDLRALFDSLQGTIEQRIEGCMRVVADLEGDAAKCDAEAARLKKRSAAYQAEATSLLALVRQRMIDSLTDSVGGTHPVWLQRNPGHVDVYAAKELPEKFRRVPPPPAWAPDLKALTAPLKAGETVPGARWVPGDLALRRG